MKSTSRLKLVATAASVVRASTRPGGPGLSERAHAVPRLVRATLDGTYSGTTAKRLALVVAAVAYIASPIDLLPEAILPIAGAADDAVVISWAINAFFLETDRFLAWELGQGRRDAGSRAGAGMGGMSGDLKRDPTRDLTRDRDHTGAASDGVAGHPTGVGPRARVIAGVRGAATNHVLESVRKRLER